MPIVGDWTHGTKKKNNNNNKSPPFIAVTLGTVS